MVGRGDISRYGRNSGSLGGWEGSKGELSRGGVGGEI